VKNLRIIIWGYPLYSHTHSYIHAAFFKAFKFLGYETYWFDDLNFPVDFNFENCIFWTEGFADKNIPLRKSSIYYVHVAPNPMKYIEAGVKEFIDVRYNHLVHKDHVYEYSLNKSEIQKIGDCVYFQEKTSGFEQLINDYVNYEVPSYRKVYITWAANFLPHEFNYEDMYLPRQNKIYFSGTLSKKGRNENYSTMKGFIKAAKKSKIKFISNDPFANPLSEEEVVRRTQMSILGVDVRGPEHVRNGYVPCRVFKSISWGHLGMTNSPEVFRELEGNVIFNIDSAALFTDAMEKRTDHQFILNAMQYVQANHTYINRIRAILSII
jgi:hypothetical protein